MTCDDDAKFDLAGDRLDCRRRLPISRSPVVRAMKEKPAFSKLFVSHLFTR